MRVACLLISHLRAKSEMHRHARLEDQPAVIVDRSGSTPLVVDRTSQAFGVRVGMTLEQAISHHADSIVLEADEPYYQQVFDDVLGSLVNVGHRVEGSELGTVYARLDGLEALYGGEEHLVYTLLRAVPHDLEPAVGVADAKFPAFVAARTGKAMQVVWVPADATRFLSPHSIDLLPVSAEIKEGLHLLGLHTIGAVAELPKGLLTDQFGMEGLQAWSLCNGIDERPLIPLEATETIVETTSFPHQSASLELFLVTVDILLKKAFSRPRMLGRQAAGVVLECSCDGALSWRKSVHFKQGLHGWRQASPIIRNQVKMDPPRTAIEEIRLSLTDLSGASGVQLGLWADPKKVKWRRIREVEKKLRSKMPANHILHRVVEVAPWHPAPEMRAVQVPVDRSENYAIKPVATPSQVSVQEGDHRRPVAVLLGNRWRSVTRVADLWTFDLWWLPQPITRIYYRLGEENGRQITLFYDRRGHCWYRQNG
ncbi:MAG: hypothetical protein J4G00_07760 [Actinomycetia bacterium]|nr:hypothetical protein [Actinomycetes bacterium]